MRAVLSDYIFSDIVAAAVVLLLESIDAVSRIALRESTYESPFESDPVPAKPNSSAVPDSPYLGYSSPVENSETEKM